METSKSVQHFGPGKFMAQLRVCVCVCLSLSGRVHDWQMTMDRESERNSRSNCFFFFSLRLCFFNILKSPMAIPLGFRLTMDFFEQSYADFTEPN